MHRPTGYHAIYGHRLYLLPLFDAIAKLPLICHHPVEDKSSRLSVICCGDNHIFSLPPDHCHLSRVSVVGVLMSPCRTLCCSVVDPALDEMPKDSRLVGQVW